MNDRDEWRREIAEMSDTERFVNCTHLRRTQTCPDCGEKADE